MELTSQLQKTVEGLDSWTDDTDTVITTEILQLHKVPPSLIVFHYVQELRWIIISTSIV